MKLSKTELKLKLKQQLQNPGFINLSDPKLAELYPELVHNNLNVPIQDFFKSNQISNEGKDIPVNFGAFLLGSNLNRKIARDLSTLLGAIEKIPFIWMNSKSLRKQYNLSDKYLIPLLAEKTRSRWIDYSRFDFIINPNEEIQIMEINSGQPACVTVDRYIHEFYSTTPEFSTFSNIYDLNVNRYAHQRAPVFALNLIKAWQKNKNTDRMPNVALLKSKYYDLDLELDLFVKDFYSLGSKCVKAYVQDLDYENSQLSHNGIPIDLCYIKFGYGDDEGMALPFSRSAKEVSNFLMAVKNDHVMVVNSLHANYLLEQKTTLSCLRHPDVVKQLNSNEKDVIERIVPKTFSLADLSPEELTHFFSQKDSYALKEALNIRCRGITLGWNSDPKQWEIILKKAHQDKINNWILQKRLTLDQYAVNGKPIYSTFGYFFMEGNPQGIFIRASENPLTSIGKNGKIQTSLIANI